MPLVSGEIEVRGEGGYQPEAAWIGQIARLRSRRSPARVMFTGEFVALLWKHKHPRMDSCGVLMSRFGAQDRARVGIGSHGTVWFSRNGKRREVLAIPYGEIPYGTIRTARWDEKAEKIVDGDWVRGWRNALETLVKHGYLMPSDELSYLIGKDTETISEMARCVRR